MAPTADVRFSTMANSNTDRSSKPKVPAANRPPKANQRNELFGLMAFSGKATTFLGPFLVAALTAASGSQRIGLSVVLFMFAGALLLTAGIATDRPGPKAR